MNRKKLSPVVKIFFTTILTAVLLTAVLFTLSGCGNTGSDVPGTTHSDTILDKITAESATEVLTPDVTEPAETGEPTQEVTELPATEVPTQEPTELPATEVSTQEPTELPATEVPTQEVTATPERCEHEYEAVKIDPTCTEKGSVTYTCKKCGDSYSEEIAKLGHSFGEWKVTKEATCKASGEKSRSCSRCGKTEKQTISGGNHQWDNGTEYHNESNCADEMIYTCTVCGSQYRQVLGYSHEFVNASTMYVCRQRCEKCYMTFTDYYAQFEDLFSSKDPNAALYTDTVHFERLPYTVRTGWSKRWKEFERNVLAASAYYRNTKGDTEYMGGLSISQNETEESVIKDYNEFRNAFKELYGWMPVDAEIIDNEFEVFFIVNAKKMHNAFKNGIESMSDEQREALTQTLIAELVYDSGIYEGMQVYDAVGLLYDTIKSRVKYDWYLGYHSAFYGLCGGSCVCDGFSEIFQRCCDFAGIKCDTIVGTCRGEGHAWNMVTFSDGTERFIDVTLDTGDYRILFTKNFIKEYKY